MSAADLRARLTAALFEADLFGLGAAPTPERIAHVVLFELAKLGDEWDETAREQYYERRNRGPIEFAAGVEEGMSWCAEILRGHAPALPVQEWR